jgi:ribosomal protein L11 methyltransferase
MQPFISFRQCYFRLRCNGYIIQFKIRSVMSHIKVTFEIKDGVSADVLIAMLDEIGYNGFEETDHELLAYVADTLFNAEELVSVVSGFDVDYHTEVIAAQNWNALWESNFEPVVVDGLCTIRAHFHDITVSTPYEIVITPKMSFGTGHHATTQLVMMTMKDIDLANKSVLDFGTGTGVLAILAEMLGAKDILAIDNDDWSVENAIENVARNSSKNITIEKGGIDEIAVGKNDIILANINRHILLQYMTDLYNRLNVDGTIVMSGLLVADKDIVVNAAAAVGFRFIESRERNNWISISFEKK